LHLVPIVENRFLVCLPEVPLYPQEIGYDVRKQMNSRSK
jgi:hypothetical protein